MEWVSLVGIIVPLFTIAGSAVAFVLKYRQEQDKENRQRFLEAIGMIHSGELGTVGQMAAIYELKFFPEHKEFTKRFCRQFRGKIKGDPEDVSILQNEIDILVATLETT